MRKQQSHLSEEYFTDKEVAKDLIDIFEKKEGFKNFKIIIEPSAGDGSFYKHLPRSSSRRVVGLDITPRASGIKKQNFLTYNFPYKNNKDEVLCIGNPPFGRQANLAKKFVHKCSEFSDHIAFVLPISFNTIAFQKSLPKGFTKKWSIKLDDDIFVDTKGRYYEQPLKTMFIYYSRDNKSKKFKEISTNGLWQFNSKTDPREREYAHFRLIRASGTPGRAIARNDPRFRIEGKTYNDYYIELLSPIKRDAKNIVKDINTFQKKNGWVFHNTTTFKSIDKTQATKVLNKITSKYL